MSIYSIPNIIGAISVLSIGLFIFLKKRKSSLNITFFILCLLLFVWLISYAITYATNSLSIAYFLCRVACTAVMFTTPVIYLFITLYLNKFNQERVYVFTFFIIMILMFPFFIFTKAFLESPIKYPWGYYSKAGFLHPFYLLIFFAPWFKGLPLFFDKEIWASTDIVRKNRTKYIFAMYFIATLGSFDYIQKYGINIYPFGWVFEVVFAFVVAYAIVRYRLMDISLVFTRTGIFVAVYSLILGIPFAIAFGWHEKLIRSIGINWWMVPLVCSTALATSGPFIYLYVNKKAEDRLLKEQRGYQNILKGASGGMIRIKDLKRLLNLIVHVVTKTVRLKHACIYLFDIESNMYALHAIRGKREANNEIFIDSGSPLVWQLTFERVPIVTEEIVLKLRDDSFNPALSSLVEQLLKLNAALVIPSFIDDKLIGLLILGEKKSRKLYSEDDLIVFSVLANQAALAIENAQFYGEVKRTHEQLFQAEKLATIGTMADGLSHQINNRFHALSLIAGDSLDVLKTLDMSSCNTEAKEALSELKNALEKIQNNVLQGGEIVKGLLKYSRPGEGGFELVDFKDILDGAVDMVQYKIRLNEIDLVRNIPIDLPKLYGNLTQLQEVFFNLIDNAYDAMKERQTSLKEVGYRGKLEVSALQVDSSLQIMVSDNGIGINELDKKNLFTPFFTTKATSRKGTGLGLYVIEKIITSHNGKISIDSIYHSGTRFTIILPTSKV